MSRSRNPVSSSRRASRKTAKDTRRGRAKTRSTRAKGRRVDLTGAGLWLLILTTPLVVIPGLADSFRLPKQAVAELFALLSIVLLAVRLGRRERVDPRRLLQLPALRAVVPLLVVASLGVLWSEHAALVAARLPSLWIGAACLVMWSATTTAVERWTLLCATMVPAFLLSLIGIAQFHHLYLPFTFADRVTERLAVTSLAGGAFDLAAYLVLPILCAQALLPRLGGWKRWTTAALLASMVYCLFLTQTLTALLALLIGTLLLWTLPVRGARDGEADDTDSADATERTAARPTAAARRRRAMLALGLLLAVGGLAVVALEPLRERVGSKVDDLRDGDFDRLTSGRLDGWRAALWMVGEKPLTGVGHGAFRAEFGDARQALRRQGVRFFRGQQNPFFVNAHSEPLEVAAELGLPGLAAALWALWLLVRRLLRRPGAGAGEVASEPTAPAEAPTNRLLHERPLQERPLRERPPQERPLHDPDWRLRVARACWGAIAILALFDFPFHLALLAFPWILLAADAFAEEGAS